MVSEYTSNTVPSYPYVTGEWLALQNEFGTSYDFRQPVVYRRYSLTEDPISGDYDWSNYTDYNIFADVQIQVSGNELVDAGQLNVGDALIFLPSRIQRDTSNASLDADFRPQIQDEIIHYGFTYKIDRMEFFRYEATEIYVKCFAKLRKDITFRP